MTGVRKDRSWSVAAAIICVVAIMFMSAQSVWADDVSDKGRAVFEKWEPSIVTVKMVTTQRMVMMGQESSKSEEKSEATGTIIDPSGLVVFSLTSSDPSSAMSKMMGALGGEPGQFKVESEVTDVKIRLPGGQELPSKIVLRDRDLDLVFVRPNEKPAEPLPAVDLAESAKPQVLDHVVVLNRLGNVASWAGSAHVDRVHAIVDKPRMYYLLGEDVTCLGAPVFALDGKVVGVLVLRTGVSGPSMGMNAIFQGMSGLGMLPIVLPAEDIIEVAQQVAAPGEQ